MVSPCGVGTVLVTVPGDDRARASASARPRMKRRRRPRPRATRCHRRCRLRWRRVTVCVVRVKASLCGDTGGIGDSPPRATQGLGGPTGTDTHPPSPPMALESLLPRLYLLTMSPRTIGRPRALCPNSLSLLGLCVFPPQGSMSLEQVHPWIYVPIVSPRALYVSHRAACPYTVPPRPNVPISVLPGA